MFSFLKSSRKAPAIEPEKNSIYAPISGDSVELKEVTDKMFAQGLLGKGLAIKPDSDIVYAPVSGRITAAPKTGHAIAILSSDGVEILIHIGINTVDLNGKYFNSFVKKGDDVSVGQKLIEFDRAKITAAGFDMITPVIVTNSDEFDEVITVTGKHVPPMEMIIKTK